MRLAVLIPTYGRREQVARLLSYLAGQTRRPDLVILSAPDMRHVPETLPQDLPVSTILGRQGLTAQRNQALDAALPQADAVVFLDDDFLPDRHYLAEVESAFRTHAEWAVLTGEVVADGITTAGLSFEDGLQLLNKDERSAALQPARAAETASAYGCNMAIRASAIGSLRFDERLPLYGWQEDVDFTRQLAGRGRIMRLSRLRGVHLGLKAGRVSGVRFGYSQIVNPAYLMRKGTVPAPVGLRQIARNVAANVAKSLWPEPYVDRRGRLWGNMLGAYHLARGRIEPEHILKL